MSDVKAVRHLLAGYAPLTAVVPATRIAAGELPQNVQLPALSVMHTSTIRRQTVAGGEGEFCTSRVQVTVAAASYPQTKAVLALVRAALPRFRGDANGVQVDSILPDIEGPDFRDDVAGIYLQSHDFIVKYTE